LYDIIELTTTKGHPMTETDTTNLNTTRTITLTEHEWLSMYTALRAHAMTQDALGYEHTAERARRLAKLLELPSTVEATR